MVPTPKKVAIFHFPGTDHGNKLKYPEFLQEYPQIALGDPSGGKESTSSVHYKKKEAADKILSTITTENFENFLNEGVKKKLNGTKKTLKSAIAYLMYQEINNLSMGNPYKLEDLNTENTDENTDEDVKKFINDLKKDGIKTLLGEGIEEQCKKIAKDTSTDIKKHLKEGVLEVQPSKIAEGIAMSLPEDKAKSIGGYLGTGDITNNELVINYLKELEDKQKLPDEIVLDGHSRGSINAIMCANEIYKKYGNKIKVHLLITDPVPGPFHEEEWKKRVIPPNVSSFSAFYTSNDKMFGPFFVPHSLDKLVFTNKQTIISSYALKDTSHGFCYFDNELAPELQYARDTILAGIVGEKNTGMNEEKVSKELGKPRFEETKLEQNLGLKSIKEVRNLLEKDPELSSKEFKSLPKKLLSSLKSFPKMFNNTEEMQSNKNRGFFRKNLAFYGETNLKNHPQENSTLVTALKKVRGDFRQGKITKKVPEYEDPPQNSGTKNISYHEISQNNTDKLSPEQRETQLYGAYRSKFKYTMTTDQVIASMLILPTLGFSANLYQAKQIHDSTLRAIYFVAGVATLNVLPVIHKTAVDIGLLTYNILVKPLSKAISSTKDILSKLGITNPAPNKEEKLETGNKVEKEIPKEKEESKKLETGNKVEKEIPKKKEQEEELKEEEEKEKEKEEEKKVRLN